MTTWARKSPNDPYCDNCGMTWDMHIAGSERCPQKTAGHEAYDEDCKRCPNYHDGTPRKTWFELGPVERHSWIMNPTPRDYPRAALDTRECFYD